jgi:hypothetical protein
MILECTLSISQKAVGTYHENIEDFSPLPEGIRRYGPCVEKNEGKLIYIYEFDESRAAEAWENISNFSNKFKEVNAFPPLVQVLLKGKDVGEGSN